MSCANHKRGYIGFEKKLRKKREELNKKDKANNSQGHISFHTQITRYQKRRKPLNEHTIIG